VLGDLKVAATDDTEQPKRAGPFGWTQGWQVPSLQISSAAQSGCEPAGSRRYLVRGKAGQREDARQSGGNEVQSGARLVEIGAATEDLDGVE
jgi:hypothetical protein